MSDHSTTLSGERALASVRAGGSPVLLKRFYQTAICVAQGNGFAVQLDGRPLLTPGRMSLLLPTKALAQAIAHEWAMQGEMINPSTMPLTRLSNSAVQGVAQTMTAVLEEIERYAGSDLLCYRATGPEKLVQLQFQAWDPVLEWVRQTSNVRFVVGAGVIFVAQLPETLPAIRVEILSCVGDGPTAPFRLAALSTMTSLTGSALLALYCAHGGAGAGHIWELAHVDEDFQASEWGSDAQAQDRRANRWLEMEAAARMLELCAAK